MGKITGIVYFILLEIIVNVSLVVMGLDAETIVRFIVIVSLSAIALIILLRRYFPFLPFRVGNVVLIDGLSGKIMSIDLYPVQPINVFEPATPLKRVIMGRDGLGSGLKE